MSKPDPAMSPESCDPAAESSAPAPKRDRGKAGKPNGRPAGTGTRQQAILDTLAEVRDQDEVPPSTAELAEMMGSDARYLYRALPILLKQGKVRCHTTSIDGQEGVLEPGTDVEGRRDLLGVMPRWSAA